MKKREYLYKCALSLLSVIIFLFLCELTIRLFYPVIKNYDMERWRYSLLGNVSIEKPRHFHTHKPNSYFKELYGVEVKINSKGLRDFEYSYSKPANVYRILVLGDSITLGWGVPFESTYAKYLEKMLNARGKNIEFQVINTGVGNYNTQIEAEFLKKEGLKYDPDMIILGYFVNDAEIVRPRRYFLNEHSYLYVYIWSKINALRADYFNQNYVNYYRAFYKDGSKSKAQFEASVEELRQAAAKNGIPLLVMLLPDLHDLKKYPFKDIHIYVEKLFEGVPVIDMLPYFDTDKASVSYWVSKEDSHYNKDAHRIIAENLYPQIIKLMNARRENELIVK